jgi:hypothetical protein
MPIGLSCGCGAFFLIPDVFAGRMGRCPTCRSRLRISNVREAVSPESGDPGGPRCRRCSALLDPEDVESEDGMQDNDLCESCLEDAIVESGVARWRSGDVTPSVGPLLPGRIAVGGEPGCFNCNTSLAGVKPRSLPSLEGRHCCRPCFELLRGKLSPDGRPLFRSFHTGFGQSRIGPDGKRYKFYE